VTVPTAARLAGPAGAIAAAAALAAGELAAGLLGAPSPVESVGEYVIDAVPRPVKEAAIALFGTADKPALVIGIVLVSLVIGWFVGRVAQRRFTVAAGLLAGFAVLGWAASTRVAGGGGAVAPSAAAAVAGVACLGLLLRSGARLQPPADPDRRRFLAVAGSALGLAALAAVAGRALVARGRSVLAGREEVGLPAASEALSAPPAGASLAVDGISPVVTPNADFYRIDTALTVPRVDVAAWRLRVTGMVERELELDLPTLLDQPMVERYVTLSCVSNEVGGDLVGNALWLGTPLGDLLDRAGVLPGAEQIVGRSVDGFTVGFPVAAAFDGREALVAVGMNGEPLPFEHGFPARLVVAGLYGYVSATKWLAEIELTTWDGFDAYWIPRGWAKEAPIKTQSRIDTPRRRAVVAAGRRPVAGVAWAPGRGIGRVEVAVDGGDWVEAALSEPLADEAWRQWVLEWDFTPGTHQIMVRATDGEGSLQDDRIRPPAPDGATGYHTITIDVE
jgi:DMSO/TMAO reductase YedYZ molybdopterin-dependent catalytic subunit